MKRIMKNVIAVVVFATYFMIASRVHAEVIVEESSSKAVFRVNGKNVSPVDAQEAARGSGRVERCNPVKGAVSLNGGASDAYKCKSVVLVINPKTGTTKWKSL